MFCGECGTQNPDTNQFCRNCGKPLTRRQPAAGQPPAQPPAAQLPPQPVNPPAPAPAVPYQQPAAPAVQQGRRWNWLGIAGAVLGLLSLGLLPLLLALGAIVLGGVSIFLFKKSTGRIGIAGILGVVLGIVTIVMFIALG